MKTIETELKKYRLCRAYMDRGMCYMGCDVCPHNIPGSMFYRFAEIDGETLS